MIFIVSKDFLPIDVTSVLGGSIFRKFSSQGDITDVPEVSESLSPDMMKSYN